MKSVNSQILGVLFGDSRRKPSNGTGAGGNAQARRRPEVEPTSSPTEMQPPSRPVSAAPTSSPGSSPSVGLLPAPLAPPPLPLERSGLCASQECRLRTSAARSSCSWRPTFRRCGEAWEAGAILPCSPEAFSWSSGTLGARGLMPLLQRRSRNWCGLAGLTGIFVGQERLGWSGRSRPPRPRLPPPLRYQTSRVAWPPPVALPPAQLR